MTIVAGRFFGALLGAAIAGWPGFLAGVLLGWWFDRHIEIRWPARAAAEAIFFETTFALMGYLAKADGRVSQAEIDWANQVMDSMGLQEADRSRARTCFRRAKGNTSARRKAVRHFRWAFSRDRTALWALLEILVQAALADGPLNPAERRCLGQIARELGLSSREFARFMAQQQAGTGDAASGMVLQDAYAILGVSADCSDDELKTAYRRLMMRHHPDRLRARGVPEDLLATAKSEAQKIQSAYQHIKAQRQGGNHETSSPS